MGTRRSQRISDAEICRLYREGQPRNMIGLKARLYDPEIIEILARNGVALRTRQESLLLSVRQRKGTLKLSNPAVG